MTRTRPLEKRFWERVNRAGPVPEHVPGIGNCWTWTANVFPEGYGRIKLPGQRSERAHRVAFFLQHGRWPEPCCLHRCDNRLCVRPEHLFEGTRADNAHDMRIKGRRLGIVATWGEGNASSRLTGEQVRALRKLRGTMKQREAALQYGISQTQVGNIWRGKQWRNLDP